MAFPLAVAFIGTLNPSAGDLGNVPILEHATLTRGAADQERTRVFARYSLVGAMTTAAGSLAAALPDVLDARRHRNHRAQGDVLRHLRLLYLVLVAARAVLNGRMPRTMSHAAAPAKVPGPPPPLGALAPYALLLIRSALSQNGRTDAVVITREGPWSMVKP